MIKRTILILAMLLFIIHGTLLYADVQEGASAESEQVESVKTVSPQKADDPVSARKRVNQLSRNEKRIYSASMRPNVVYKLQTALGYASTIDLPEPALKVFIGDQELFKVGVYEREVIIKPITDEPEARTNLTIVTKNSRLTFDVTVGKPETADFVIDFRLPEEDMLVENAFEEKVKETESVLKEKFQKKEEQLESKAVELSEEKLKSEVKKGNEAIQLRDSAQSGDIRLNLLSFSTIGAKSYIRFSIRNLSKSTFKIREIVLGLQTYESKTLGLRKVKEGLIEIPSEMQAEGEVAPDTYQYGVIQFDRRTLKKDEKPVFLVFEEGGMRNIRIEGFRWLD